MNHVTHEEVLVRLRELGRGSGPWHEILCLVLRSCDVLLQLDDFLFQFAQLVTTTISQVLPLFELFLKLKFDLVIAVTSKQKIKTNLSNPSLMSFTSHSHEMHLILQARHILPDVNQVLITGYNRFI